MHNHTTTQPNTQPLHNTSSHHGRRHQQHYLQPHTSYPSNRLVANRLWNRLQANATIVGNGRIFTKFWTSESWWLNSSSPPQSILQYNASMNSIISPRIPLTSSDLNHIKSYIFTQQPTWLNRYWQSYGSANFDSETHHRRVDFCRAISSTLSNLWRYFLHLNTDKNVVYWLCNWCLWRQRGSVST